jgi:hypothetical protein
VVPLKASDSMTVSSAIFQLITQFGLCSTFISDRGSEFISQCTSKLYEMLNIHQNFTPSFVHHDAFRGTVKRNLLNISTAVKMYVCPLLVIGSEPTKSICHTWKGLVGDGYEMIPDLVWALVIFLAWHSCKCKRNPQD